MENDIEISTTLLIEINKIAFGELYDWAGKWRTVNVTVGSLIPPKSHQVTQLMYQFIDNLNYKMSVAKTREDHLNVLVYAHHEFVRIHPFNNGNGRTGRMLVNLLALKFGYRPVELYHRAGESRMLYIKAMRSGDSGNFELLKQLLIEELVTF